MIVSILKLIGIALATMVVMPIVILVSPLDRHARVAYRLCQAWCRVLLTIGRVRVQVRRLAPLDPRTPYVFMSNHRSHFDVVGVVVALSEFQLRWVAKRELTRVPFFGWALRIAKHVVIDRSDHDQAVRSLSAARSQMLDGISVVIFPEGTRAVAGQELLPLKKGGFMLALETGFPIVPVCVRGSLSILPRGSWRVRRGTMDIVVGEPIEVAIRTRDELMERVREFMLAHLGAAAAGGEMRTVAGAA